MVTFSEEGTHPSVDWRDRRMDGEKGKERTVKGHSEHQTKSKGRKGGKTKGLKSKYYRMDCMEYHYVAH